MLKLFQSLYLFNPDASTIIPWYEADYSRFALLYNTTVISYRWKAEMKSCFLNVRISWLIKDFGFVRESELFRCRQLHLQCVKGLNWLKHMPTWIHISMHTSLNWFVSRPKFDWKNRIVSPSSEKKDTGVSQKVNTKKKQEGALIRKEFSALLGSKQKWTCLLISIIYRKPFQYWYLNKSSKQVYEML